MNEKYMILALEEAKKAKNKGEIPIGAVIVYKDQVIAQNHNLKETLHCATKHAEILVIEEASEFIKDWRLNECDLYVTMEPCIMCCGALLQSRIKNVYYLVDNEKFGGIKCSSYEHTNHYINYQKIINEELINEYVNMLKKFFLEKR